MDTKIGENAMGLSEGQAQRIAIARAVISGAPILLLDEATSALDEMTEKRVLENIKKLKERTCIIITHKQAALDVCDKEFIIKDRCLYQKIKWHQGLFPDVTLFLCPFVKSGIIL